MFGITWHKNPERRVNSILRALVKYMKWRFLVIIIITMIEIKKTLGRLCYKEKKGNFFFAFHENLNRLFCLLPFFQAVLHSPDGLCCRFATKVKNKIFLWVIVCERGRHGRKSKTVMVVGSDGHISTDRERNQVFAFSCSYFTEVIA